MEIVIAGAMPTDVATLDARVNLTKSGATCHLYYAHTQFNEHLKLRYFDG